MGQKQSVQVSKTEILGELQSRTVFPEDPLWDHLFELGSTPSLLVQFRFSELFDLLDNQPVNVAVLLYRLATDLHAIIHHNPIENSELVHRIRWLNWVMPTIIANNENPHKDKILFFEGPLRAIDLSSGPRRISHPPPSTDGSNPSLKRDVTDLVLRVPGEDPNRSLAQSLVSTLSQLLFLPGFTIPANTGDQKIWLVNNSGCGYAIY